MAADRCVANAECIDLELNWFNHILQHRFQLRADGQPAEPNLFDLLPPPALPHPEAPYAELVLSWNLQPDERLILILSLIPHLRPNLLDTFFVQNQTFNRGFTEFGGLTGQSHAGFLPTCETAMFLLADDNLSARLRYDSLFSGSYRLFSHGILQLDRQHGQEPPLSAALQISPDYRERIIRGQVSLPDFRSDFPAQRISSDLEWDELVLNASTRDDLDDILTWLQHRHVLGEEWQLHRYIRPGFRSLFHGPPGTGKTLAACLLGKRCGLPVFRIDLSRVISKFIGETEKNLSRLFDQAHNREWILFFDEADALFSQRVESRSSTDRSANQEISYLLQRIEDYSGLVVLATNLRSHLDEAFFRRFQAVIRFPMPSPQQRLDLWRKLFTNGRFALSEDVDLVGLANEHELTGGSITNVLHYACIKAIGRQPATIAAADLQQGISRELRKSGRSSGEARRGYLGGLPAIRAGGAG
jgi:AAA+ superfamily predicted ATPase